MNSRGQTKKMSMLSYLTTVQKGMTNKTTFESLTTPKPSNRLIHEEYGPNRLEWNLNKFSNIDVPSLQSFLKYPASEDEEYFKRMAAINTHLDLPRDDDDKDLEYTPYDYTNGGTYGVRPQTSYMAVPFASRNRVLESIAECLTPSSSGGDLTPEYNETSDVKHERVEECKQVVLPKIDEEKRMSPVKVKPVLSINSNDKLPSIQNTVQRIEKTETFLAQTRFMNQNRSESVESIATPSTSRCLLWSRESIMSDGGFSKARSDTNISKLSCHSEPTPTLLNFSKDGIGKKKLRKRRRKPATKCNVPYRSFLDSVVGKKKCDEKKNPKKYIKSDNFSLSFPSINKKVTVKPVRKTGKWCSK